MEEFGKVILAQQQALHSITRTVPNLKKLGQAKITPEVIKRRQGQLEGLWADCRKRDVILQSIATEKQRQEHEYFVNNQFDTCEDAFNDTMDQLDRMMVSQTTVDNKCSHEEKPCLQTPVPLSPLVLPNFDGVYDKWETFRDRFTSLVIKNKRLKDVDRMNYLYTALTGKALQAIERLTVSDANFESVWEVLKDNFEHKRCITFTHCERLYNPVY